MTRCREIHLPRPADGRVMKKMVSSLSLNKQKILVWLAFFGVLFWGYLLKRPCLEIGWGGASHNEYKTYCYNDIQALYGARGLSERKIPYFEVLPYEYPPLIAGQMYLTSLFTQDHAEFFIANFFVNLIGLALSLFFLLKILTGPSRALLFCLSSSLFLYAAMNWDASSVLLLVLVLFCRKHESWVGAGAFAALSLGGKLFPVLCLLPLFFETWKSKETLKKLIIGALIGGGVLYLPLILFSFWKEGNLDPLLSIFLFHAKRLPEYDTFWHWTAGLFGYSPVSDAYRVFVERTSAVLFMLGAVAIMFFSRNTKSLPEKSGALIVLLLLVSKIYSPQYALWLLPFIVVNPLPIKAVYAFYLTDIWGFFARFNWYQVMGTPDEFFWKNQLMWAVLCRTTVLLFFFYCWGLKSNKSARQRSVLT